ncbi:MAG: Fe2+ or Zn2+ uptake regulation protein [Oceanicoccus sp.]|jgi:Fe2+ or Zn2+ uptake regulation protein
MSKRARKSPQRDLILDILKKDAGHLRADEIYKRARKSMSKISLATVYRNLGALEEAKAVTQVLGPNNLSLFEVYAEPHHHFVCESCDSIKNLETPGVHMCVKCIEDKGGAKVNAVYTTIYGVCKTCR